MTEKNAPAKKFKAGPVYAIIWTNQSEKGTYSTVQLERRYKDTQGWKSTGSLRVNDLPKAALVLNKAFDYLVSEDKAESQSKAESLDGSMEEVM